MERVARFRAGFLEAGGDPAVLEHVIGIVIVCEYGRGDFERAWRPYDHANPLYMSRAQFHPDSWARAGGGDPADDHQVGANVARWLSMIGIEAAGTTSGWVVCWNR